MTIQMRLAICMWPGLLISPVQPLLNNVIGLIPGNLVMLAVTIVYLTCSSIYLVRRLPAARSWLQHMPDPVMSRLQAVTRYPGWIAWPALYVAAGLAATRRLDPSINLPYYLAVASSLGGFWTLIYIMLRRGVRYGRDRRPANR
jgi:hypothetical protein